MKFVAPEVEVKKFDLVDVLTVSGETQDVSARTDTLMEGSCIGNDYDQMLSYCL